MLMCLMKTNLSNNTELLFVEVLCFGALINSHFLREAQTIDRTNSIKFLDRRISESS